MPDTVQFENLNDSERKAIVDQALVLFEELYVHLPLKEAMHAVRPIQRLKVLRANVRGAGSDFDFHNEMTEIFNSVRDLHTNYLLPEPFASRIAYLPFEVEALGAEDARQYIVTHLIAGFTDAHFVPGVEILHWGGVPITRAVKIAAQKHAGSNLAARHAQGVRGLTMRPLVRSLPPDAEWIEVTYRALDGKKREKRFRWDIYVIPSSGQGDAGSATAIGRAAAMGLDIESDFVRLATKNLFIPDLEKLESKRRSEKFPFPPAPAALNRAEWPEDEFPTSGYPSSLFAVDHIPLCGGETASIGSATDGNDVASFMPEVFNARAVATTSGTFGYIRIRTFSVDNAWQFVLEFARLASLLPQNGLIIDVRDNGGGLILAGEMLLQTITPKRVEPERLQFINTPLVHALIEHHSGNDRPYSDLDLTPWRASARLAVRTGAPYTRGFPLTPVRDANLIGQQYHGPVILITNARCYSTTDIFAAGFKDHAIGRIIGTDANTGAGGANVWPHGLLQDIFAGVPDNPITSLPQKIGMRVSIRRTLRVGPDAGTPLEDLGVEPDLDHHMTRRDLLEGNLDLIDTAGAVLAQETAYALALEDSQTANSQLTLSLRTDHLDRVDAYVDERPFGTTDVTNDAATITVPTPAAGGIIDLKGFANGRLRATRRLFM